MGIPGLEELESETEGTSSRDGLGTSNSSILKGSVVLTIGKLESLGDVAVKSLNTSVLVIHILLKDDLFSTSNAREDVGLAFIVSVSSHTEKHLLGVSLLLESFVQTEDGVGGGRSKSRPGRELSVTVSNELAVGTLDKASEHV